MDHLLIIALAEKLARSEHRSWLTQQAWMDSGGPARETLRERLRRRGGNPELLRTPVTQAADSSLSLAGDAALERLRMENERERQKLADLFEGAPVFIAVLGGPDHVFEMVNESYRELMGNRELIGKRVVDCVPEVAGTVWMDLLDHVYRTGQPRVERGARLSLAPAQGQPLEDKFVDYTYKARRESDGTISGIIALGVDTSLVQEVLQSTSASTFLLDEN
ncbi:PAS domain-containing protein [Terriglobus roseus]|nr:PAS domain-containing protein [Terriglobus roseus]